MRALYVHGFGGSANGESSKIVLKALKEAFPKENIELIAPAIPYMNPKEAVDFITSLSDKVDLVVASSLGAFYTSLVDNVKKLLINPAMPEDVKRISPDIPYKMFEELVCINNLREHKINDLKMNTYLMFGQNDEVLNNKSFYSDRYLESHIYNFNGMHRISEKDVRDLVHVLKDMQ